MQLTIDTVAKTIKVKNAENIGELIEELSKTLLGWKEYKLESESPYFPNPTIPFEPLPFVPFIPTSPWQPYPPQPTSPYQPYYPQSPIYHQREPYTITCKDENMVPHNV